MKCPRCRGDDARLLGTLNPGIILECLRCGKVWNVVRGNGGKPRRRRGGRTKRKEVLAVKVKISPADLKALKRLRRVVLRRCRAGLKRSSIAVGSPAPSSDYWDDMEVHKDG